MNIFCSTFVLTALALSYFVGWPVVLVVPFILAWDIADRHFTPKTVDDSSALKKEISELREKVNNELLQRAMRGTK